MSMFAFENWNTEVPKMTQANAFVAMASWIVVLVIVLGSCLGLCLTTLILFNDLSPSPVEFAFALSGLLSCGTIALGCVLLLSIPMRVRELLPSLSDADRSEQDSAILYVEHGPRRAWNYAGVKIAIMSFVAQYLCFACAIIADIYGGISSI